MQRQVPQIQTVPKTWDFPSINHVTKRVELLQTQHTDKVVDVPAVLQQDCGSPAGAVRRQSCGGACDHADVSMPREEDRQVEEGSSPRTSDPSASPSNFALIWAEVARREVERE